MSKRTKKQKQKKKQIDQAVAVSNEVKCLDCEWEGQAHEIHFNGKADKMECPNCVGNKFLVAGGRELYNDPDLDPIDYTNRASSNWIDGYCNDCKWRGPDYALKVDPKTAKDLCPECGSTEVDFIDYLAPGPDGTPALKKDNPFGYGFKPSKFYTPCYENHPALSLSDGLVIYGGSCISPRIVDCDIYIGFDHGMTMTKRSLPWTEGYDVSFPIPDAKVPDDLDNFIKLVEWTADALREGKKVHAGCIGGHGRTGLFFAALVAHMGVDDDPIAYVRDNYCDKAVESKTQTDFLVKNFKVVSAVGSKVKPKSKTKKKVVDGYNWSGGEKLW